MLCPACGSENIDGSDRCENCLAPFRDLDVPRADSAEGLARSVMADDLSKLDHDETLSVTPDTSAMEVVQRMKEAHSGCALVLDGKKLVGIFTEHDVLLRMADRQRSKDVVATETAKHPSIPIPASDIPFSDIPLEEIRAEEFPNAVKDGASVENEPPMHFGPEVSVKDLMSHNPETLHEQDSVAAALNKMSLGRYRHLPVQRRDGSYSVASIRSVLKYIAQEDW